MRRTWFWSLALTLTPAAAFAQYGAPLQPAPAPTPAPATAAPAPATAAPVAAPPPVGADYGGGTAVAIGPTMPAPAGDRAGLEFAARLMLVDAVATRLVDGNLKFLGQLDHLPRIYGGYHLSGKLAIMVGLQLVNTSSAGGELLTEDVETAALGWSIAPGVTYELLQSVTANITLDIFGNLIYGQGTASFKDSGAEAESEWAWSTTGIDLGARITHWFSPGFGAGFDLGLTYANTTGEHAGNDNAAVADNANESADQAIAIYGAMQLTGIFLP